MALLDDEGDLAESQEVETPETAEDRAVAAIQRALLESQAAVAESVAAGATADDTSMDWTADVSESPAVVPSARSATPRK